MAFEEKYVDLPTRGERICYAEGGNLDGEVVLTIHGNYSSYKSMVPFIEELGDEYRVLCVDLRGFGRSSYNHPISSVKEMSDDLVEMCQVLGITKAVVLGHSLGGGVAAQFAIDAPEVTDKLVLSCPTCFYGYPLFKGNQEVGFTPFASMEDCMTSDDPVGKAIQVTVNTLKSGNFDAYLQMLSKMGGHTEEPTERFIASTREAFMQKDLLADDWALMTWNITDMPSLYSKGTGEYKKILAPTLFYSAGKDTFVFPFMVDINVNHLKWKGENFVHKHIENAIHTSFLDESEGGAKTEFFKALKSFLKTGKLAD